MKKWQSIVVTGDTLGELERRCNQEGQNEYEPVGFTISRDGEFYVALLKREREIPEPPASPSLVDLKQRQYEAELDARTRQTPEPPAEPRQAVEELDREGKRLRDNLNNPGR